MGFKIGIGLSLTGGNGVGALSPVEALLAGESTGFAAYFRDPDPTKRAVLKVGGVSTFIDLDTLMRRSSANASTFGVKITHDAENGWGRTTHNLMGYSGDLTNAAWAKTAASAPAAGTFRETAVFATHLLQQTQTAVVGSDYVAAFEVLPDGRANCFISMQGNRSIFNLQGAGSVTSEGSGNTSSIEALSDGYYRIKTSCIVAANVVVQIGTVADDGSTLTFTGDANKGLRIRKAQLNYGRKLTRYVPTVLPCMGPPIIYDYVTHDWKGMLYEPQAANLVLYSRDLSNAAWTKTNMSVALTAEGIFGDASGASTITATADNATVTQALTSASALRVSSAFLRRRSGVGTIELTQDGGTTWVLQEVSDEWNRVSLPSVTSANPTVGIRLGTSGDSIDVDIVQHETNTTFTGDPTFATNPIITYGSAITRLNDSLLIFLADLIGVDITSGGTALLGFELLRYGNGRYLNFSDTTNNERISIAPAVSGRATMDVFDGGVSQGSIATPNNNVTTLGTRSRLAAVYQANRFNIAQRGEVGTADTSGTMPTLTYVNFGSNVVGTAGHMYLTDVVFLPRVMSDAEITAATVATFDPFRSYHILGDSFANPEMQLAFRQTMVDTSLAVTLDGVGGSLLTDQLSRFTADLGSHGKILVVMDGGRGDDAATTISSVDSMVLLLDHDRWLYCQSMYHATMIIGTPARTAKDAEEATIKASFGARYVETHAALLAANDGSAGDLADVANGICPRSLRLDDAHLNAAGKLVWCAAVKAELIAQGWFPAP